MLVRSQRDGWALTAAGALLFAATFTWFGEQRLYALHAGRDVGLFLQSLLAAAHGHGMANTIEGNHFAVHDSPLLLVLTPLVALRPSPTTLIAAAAILIAAGSLALYGFARRAGHSPAIATAVALLYLAYPAVHGFAFYNDFNENVFVPVCGFAFAWALAARQPWVSVVAALALLAIKEDQGIFVAWIGALCALRADRPMRAALVTCSALGVATVALYLATHRAVAGTQFYSGSPFSLLLPKAGSFLELLAPLASTPLFAGRLWLLALPMLFELYGASAADIFRIGSHYEVSFVTFLFVASVLGLRRVKSPWCWVAAAAAVCAILVPLTDPSPLHLGPRYRYRAEADAAFIERARTRLASGDSVGVPEEYFPFVADFPQARWDGSKIH